jgi:ubiquinone/menaquinone biosynthesis C-methylase UbiE
MVKELSSNENLQKKYYNKISHFYDHYSFNKYALQYRFMVYDKIFKGIHLEGKKILDAMCGSGANSSYFINKNCIIWGLDLSEEQCNLYAKRFPGNKVKCESILNTSFANNTFDLIVVDSLRHIQPDIHRAITELSRILKSGGYLLLWEPNINFIINMLRKIWYKIDPVYFQDNEHSIDIKKIIGMTNINLKPYKIIYGGHLAYLMVLQSMILRIPIQLVRFYAPWLIKLENKFNSIADFFPVMY